MKDLFGYNVFNEADAARTAAQADLQGTAKTIKEGASLDPAIADAVAAAMKDWAIEKGATHFTHIFQPMTGLTAEKHDSFLHPTGDGKAITEFSGKELIKGEPDAVLVPLRRHSRHLRSPRLHRLGPDQPRVHLRKPQRRHARHPHRVPQLDRRSARQENPPAALDGGAVQAGPAHPATVRQNDAKKVFTTVGPEQEYFLIDKNFYYARARPAQRRPHAVRRRRPRARSWRTSISARSRSACWPAWPMRGGTVQAGRAGQDPPQRSGPSQYEIAPIFEDSNLATDHQMLTMEMLRNDGADKYGLACLLHEKPFAGINGSGKHNNWSMSTDAGENLLNPGDTPHDNAQFLVFCVAVIRAVAKYPELLRVSVASGRATTTGSGPTKLRRRSSRSSWATSFKT